MNARLTRLTSCATGDVDEQAALLRGWNQSYAQLSAGPFEGRIEDAWLDGVHLFVESTSRRLMQRGELARDRLAIGLPLVRGTGQALFCGGSPDSATGYCTFSGPEGFEFFTPEGLVMAGIELDRAELLGLASDAEQAAIEQIGLHAGLHHAEPQAVASLRNFMHGAFDLLRREPGLLGNGAVRHTLRQAALSQVLETLAQPLCGGTPAAADLSPQRQWKLVAQAREHLQRDPETPMTVAALCQALRVSRRTLQSAFQEVLGMPPAAFLRAVRLAGARRALRVAPTVTEAAAQWGFWHFSHFAQDFRRMFGELPSEAWRRMHREPSGPHVAPQRLQ